MVFEVLVLWDGFYFSNYVKRFLTIPCYDLLLYIYRDFYLFSSVWSTYRVLAIVLNHGKQQETRGAEILVVMESDNKQGM